MTPFDELDPDDGYRVRTVDQGRYEVSLHVGLFLHGDLANAFSNVGDEASQEIFSRKNPSSVDRGVLARNRLLAEAICRFFNTGGTWDEYHTLLEPISRAIEASLEVPGWHLYDSYLTTHGQFVHVFVADQTLNVVQWIEGLSVEDTKLTLEDYLQLDAEEDDDVGVRSTEELPPGPYLQGPGHPE